MMKTLPVPNTTARELLELVAGDAHATHSIAKHKLRSTMFVLTCSCGENFTVPHSGVVVSALRNVPEGM